MQCSHRERRAIPANAEPLSFYPSQRDSGRQSALRLHFARLPPALGAITLNALSAADLLIIPTQAEYFSAYALRNMMGTIRRVRQESNPNLAYRILVTLLDRRNRTHRNIFEQLQATFGQGVFTTVIEIDTKLRESPIAGVPITQYKPTSRGSQQYRVLAQELIEYAKEEASRQAA